MFSTVDEIKFWIEPQINPYRGPLFITRSLESPVGDNIITNGGFGLVDTGKKNSSLLASTFGKNSKTNTAKTRTSECAFVSTSTGQLSSIRTSRLTKTQNLILQRLTYRLSWRRAGDGSFTAWIRILLRALPRETNLFCSATKECFVPPRVRVWNLG